MAQCNWAAARKMQSGLLWRMPILLHPKTLTMRRVVITSIRSRDLYCWSAILPEEWVGAIDGYACWIVSTLRVICTWVAIPGKILAAHGVRCIMEQITTGRGGVTRA